MDEEGPHYSEAICNSKLNQILIWASHMFTSKSRCYSDSGRRFLALCILRISCVDELNAIPGDVTK